MAETSESSMNHKWQAAWQYPDFRKRTIVGTLLLFFILTIFPIFFRHIEKRNGTVLNDWVLNHLPAMNMSVPIFIIIWAATALIIVRVIQHPDIFITILWSYVLLNILRIITISLVALDPPRHLVELKDPIINTIYGLTIITKDLFFSGHTSSLFLMFLCLKSKNDKAIALTATCAVGILLMIQHVHYTIDVVAAIIFTYFVYKFARKYIHC